MLRDGNKMYIQGYTKCTKEIVDALNTLGATPKVKLEDNNGWWSIQSFWIDEDVFNKYFIKYPGCPEYPGEIVFKNEGAIQPK